MKAMGCNTSKVDPSENVRVQTNGVGDKIKFNKPRQRPQQQKSRRERDSVPEFQIPNHDEVKDVNGSFGKLSEILQENNCDSDSKLCTSVGDNVHVS